MIKFFRKIRQRLLSENKFSKYLVYAVGEIILVVIGILIALQINNWNQNRLDRKTEITYLTNIKKEIITNNQFNIKLVINRLPKKIEGLKLAKKFCEHKMIVTDTLEFLNKVSYGGVFSNGHNFGARSSYDELINTGNLQLIKKDTIKNSIAGYYEYINAITNRAKVHSSSFSNYTSELRPFDSENPSFISKSDQLEMIESLNTVTFKKLVDLELSYAYKVRDYVKNVSEMGNKTIHLIDQELTKELH